MRSSVNTSNSFAVIKVLIKSAGRFYFTLFFFIKGKNTKKPLFRIDRMAQNRRRTQGTGLVSCRKSLYRKLTANNIGDPAKEADLGDVIVRSCHRQAWPWGRRAGEIRKCVCVCYLEKASQLKIWVGEQSQVGGGLWNILSQVQLSYFSKFKKILCYYVCASKCCCFFRDSLF